MMKDSKTTKQRERKPNDNSVIWSTYNPLTGEHNGRWAISRQDKQTEEWVALIERTPVREEVAKHALRMLGKADDLWELAGYFPQSADGHRRPTFELMQLWYQLDIRKPTDGTGV